MRRGYIPFLQRTCDEFQPDFIIHIGDLVDWHAICYHERNPDLPGPRDEARRARRQVRRLFDAIPIDCLLIGNHDDLPGRQARTAGLPSDLLRSYADYWEIDCQVIPRYESMTIDGVRYSHGETGPQGMHGAIRQAKENFRSTAIGHLHSNGGIEWHVNSEFRVFGLSVGCGVDHRKLSMEYGRKFTRKPFLGCAGVVDGKVPYSFPWLLGSR